MIGPPSHKLWCAVLCCALDVLRFCGADVQVRAYREKMMAPTGIQPMFPLW